MMIRRLFTLYDIIFYKAVILISAPYCIIYPSILLWFRTFLTLLSVSLIALATGLSLQDLVKYEDLKYPRFTTIYMIIASISLAVLLASPVLPTIIMLPIYAMFMMFTIYAVRFKENLQYNPDWVIYTLIALTIPVIFSLPLIPIVAPVLMLLFALFTFVKKGYTKYALLTVPALIHQLYSTGVVVGKYSAVVMMPTSISIVSPSSLLAPIITIILAVIVLMFLYSLIIGACEEMFTRALIPALGTVLPTYIFITLHLAAYGFGLVTKFLPFDIYVILLTSSFTALSLVTILITRCWYTCGLLPAILMHASYDCSIFLFSIPLAGPVLALVFVGLLGLYYVVERKLKFK